MFRPQERRRDPEDGIMRTFAEVQAHNRNRYTPQEIRSYWDTQCVHAETVSQDPFLTHMRRREGPQDEPDAHNVARDPFMVHSQRRNSAEDPFVSHNMSTMPADGPFASHTRREEVPPSDPFVATYPAGDMDDGPVSEMANVRNDPFLTHVAAGANSAQLPRIGARRGSFGIDSMPGSAGSLRRRNEHSYEKARTYSRDFTDAAGALLGPGDPDRVVAARGILVLVPWLTFMWTLLLWLLLRHYMPSACVLLTMVLAGACCILIQMSNTSKTWGSVHLFPLGLLCLVAVVSASFVGDSGWRSHWRQYWWMQTGSRVEGNSASSPAAGHVDASVIGFWDLDKGGTVNGTYVDNLRSAGYKDGHYFCVAPIISPETADGGFIRVNYWAIGVDCCQRSGSFVCDDSRDFEAGYGVVMVNGGFPCPDCHVDQFRSAVLKAEAMHGLVSAPGALFVRWVRNPLMLEAGALMKAILFVLLAGLIAFLVLWVLASLAWYYGLGRRSMLAPGGIFEGFQDSSRQKLLA